MFELKNVSKKYQDEIALNNVSLKMGEGLNFIVGASGSGKTTLLKIISGMDQNFEGKVSYGHINIKKMTENDKSYFYNNIFGFVWQDFNLLEESTALENILLPSYIKDNELTSTKLAKKAMKDLKILHLADKKVKFLSGGQKQRVAIVRELVKNPKVIIADEPTSALDEKTAKTTINILRELAKERTVIVVTHDTSMISDKDNVFELDKGELVATKTNIKEHKTISLHLEKQKKLSFKNACCLAKMNIKNKFGRFVIAIFSLSMASILLLTTMNGIISGNAQEEFNKLFEKYGDGLLDISLISNYTGSGGTDGSKNSGPNGDVSQDLGGLYDQYANDERVQFALFLQAFTNITINMENKKYTVKSSGNVPVINKLISGIMPTGNDNEVIVPESFLKQVGLDKNNILGKEIDFSSSIYNWDSGNAVSKNIHIKAKIVGVINTDSSYEYGGKSAKFSVDDSFFFSKTALDDLRKQANLQNDKVNFQIRAKKPADMIAIKDELNKKGIIPLGHFELVEDLVRLENQTSEQTGFASFMITILSVFIIIAVFMITGLLRKREYAIYKISGFSNKSLHMLNMAETLLFTISSAILIIVASPLFNAITKNLFHVSILHFKLLALAFVLVIPLSVIAFIVTLICYIKTNTTLVLKSGDKE